MTMVTWANDHESAAMAAGEHLDGKGTNRVLDVGARAPDDGIVFKARFPTPM
jgi:hypothetical protein